MKKINLLYILPFAAILYSCEPEFKDKIVFEPGEADFRNYVAIGNSLTAGFQSGALSREGQLNSYPAILAQQFAKVEPGMSTFRQPLLPEGPGIGLTGNSKLVLDYRTDCTGEVSLSPEPAADQGGQASVFHPSNYIGDPEIIFHNVGVPGAKTADIVKKNYGNPFFLRFANPAVPDPSILNAANTASPTFYSLWIGNNDILGYALSGGEEGTITPSSSFRADLRTITTDLGQRGVIANIPAITSIPYFNTIPWNGLTISQAQADSLNAAYQQYNAALDAAVGSSSLTSEEAERRKISFNAGANAFVIVDNDLTDLSGVGIPNYRQITNEELITLSIPLDSVKCDGFGSANPNTKTASPITEQYVLDADEIELVKTAVSEYNSIISSKASDLGLALVDTYSLIKEFENGVSYDGVDYSTEFVTGGLFSLDGVHPNSRGYAIIANAHIDAINETYDANVPKVNVNDYEGITFPN